MYRTIHAEITKIRTHPATLYTVLATLLIPPALSIAMGLGPAGNPEAVTNVYTQGFEVAGFGQPLVILLAAVIAGSEYQHGLLRSSQLATPNRARLLAAKAILTAVISFVLAVLSIGLAVILRQAVLGDIGLTITEFTPSMWLNLLTVALNWTLISLIAFALTVLARSILLPVIVLVPMVLGLGVALVSVLPWLKYAPDLAGLQLIALYPGLGLLDPLPGGIVMATWAIVLLIPAFIVFQRRDT